MGKPQHILSKVFNNDNSSGVALKNKILKGLIFKFLDQTESASINEISKEINISVPKTTSLITELIEEGLDSLLVENLFPQLSYIDLKNRATSVVYQNGTISFTTYYRRFLDVNTTQIINGKGDTDIRVKTIGVGPGNVTDEVLLIELH